MDYLDIFYNYIVKEAATGRIPCFLDYRVVFETSFLETGEKVVSTCDADGIILPTLTIHNRELFNKLLCEYVDICKNFYRACFGKEVLERKEYEINRTCPEKMIMIFLWANATFDDFLNPERYLEKRIAFLNNKEEDISTEMSQILKGRINFKIEKDTIVYETPYKIASTVISEEDEIYRFPEIRFGIYGDTVYFYTIQNPRKEENRYTKFINRALYKVNDGYVDDGSALKDITPSFVVAINMAINYFYSQGYRKIDISSILITRWNAKKIVLQNKWELDYVDDLEREEILKNQDNLQKNLTEKFLHTFLRLASQYEGMEVVALPYDVDTSMHMELEDKLDTSNILLRETGTLIREKNNAKKI